MLTRLDLNYGLRDLRRRLPGLRFERRSGQPRATLPGGLLPVATAGGVQAVCWGLVGGFLDAPPRQPLLDLPGSGLMQRPFYSRLFRERRCLVPIAGLECCDIRSERRYFLTPEDGRTLLLAGIVDHHPAVGWSMALLVAPSAVSGLAARAMLPLEIFPDEAASWLDAEEAAAVDLPRATADWQCTCLPAPEPDPQLSFRFA